jgi:hypothetical protein
MEGKTVITGNIAKTLKVKKVLFLNHDGQEPLRKSEKLNKILGYSDPRIDFKTLFRTTYQLI